MYIYIYIYHTTIGYNSSIEIRHGSNTWEDRFNESARCSRY